MKTSYIRSFQSFYSSSLLKNPNLSKITPSIERRPIAELCALNTKLAFNFTKNGLLKEKMR
jgi:hypothetical protein